MESQPSADTEEEALRRRLEELTSNISDPGTSSEDETKPGGTLHAVSPEVRSHGPRKRAGQEGQPQIAIQPFMGGSYLATGFGGLHTGVEVGDQPWGLHSEAVLCFMDHHRDPSCP